jgi:hypothetical protein
LYDETVSSARSIEFTKFWDNDGEPSSLNILLNWITEETNADRYFGAEETRSKTGFSTDDGVTKNALCKLISERIHQENGVERSPASVRSKIDDLVARFKSTNDWIFATGQGVRETEGESNFRDIVISKFRFYYDLEPILSQRPSIRPSFTTDDPDDPVEPEEQQIDFNSQDIQESQNSEDTSSIVPDDENEQFITPTNNKRNASSAKKSYSEAKKKSKTSSASSSAQPLIHFGSTDSIDEYLMQKKQENVEKLEIEKKRLEIEQKRFVMDSKLMMSTNALHIATNNMKVMEMRDKVQAKHPEMSRSEIERMFPMYTEQEEERSSLH